MRPDSRLCGGSIFAARQSGGAGVDAGADAGPDGAARAPRRRLGAARLLKDAAYFLLVLVSIPFTMLEAACRAGSTIMIEARLKP